MLKAYNQSDKSTEKDEELKETLNSFIKGTEAFISQLQSKGEMDSAVAKTVIEQQMIIDGLIDPLEDKLESSARQSK